MINKLFMGFTLVGSEWVLWFLIALSIFSIALIIERSMYFKKTRKGVEEKITSALKSITVSDRPTKGQYLVEKLIAETRLGAENRLSWLATIGSNAPFIGLFGTVLGIIRAFHDLSESAAGAQNSSLVSSGISEALVATAVGLFVAIPAVIAYNYFQRQVKEMILRSERAKNEVLSG